LQLVIVVKAKLFNIRVQGSARDRNTVNQELIIGCNRRHNLVVLARDNSRETTWENRASVGSAIFTNEVEAAIDKRTRRNFQTHFARLHTGVHKVVTSEVNLSLIADALVDNTDAQARLVEFMAN
jgi:hypothetical protein